MLQFRANPNFVANSIAFLLITGLLPGNPPQMLQTFVLGLDKLVEQLQKSLEFRFNWIWTSRPIIAF